MGNENSVPANVRKLTFKDQIRVLIMAYKRMQDIHLAESVRILLQIVQSLNAEQATAKGTVRECASPSNLAVVSVLY